MPPTLPLPKSLCSVHVTASPHFSYKNRFSSAKCFIHIKRNCGLRFVHFFNFDTAGIELSFFSGVYSTCLGFTHRFPDPKRLVGLSGMFIGVGEILGLWSISLHLISSPMLTIFMNECFHYQFSNKLALLTFIQHKHYFQEEEYLVFSDQRPSSTVAIPLCSWVILSTCCVTFSSSWTFQQSLHLETQLIHPTYQMENPGIYLYIVSTHLYILCNTYIILKFPWRDSHSCESVTLFFHYSVHS